MKRLAVRLTVLSIILLAGCDDTPIEFHEGLAAVEKDGKWGYIDTLENVVIPHLYDSAGHFADGVAVVGLNKKIGAINKSGMVIIAIKYDSIGRFTDSVTIVGHNGKYGFVDISGKEVISLKYDSIGRFTDSLAMVSDSGKYGFVDISGKEVIAPLYESVTPFVGGWATVVQNGDTFKIDRNGEKNLLIGTWSVRVFSFETDPNKVQQMNIAFAPASEQTAETMVFGDNGAFQCNIDLSSGGNVVGGGKAMALAKNNKWRSIDYTVTNGNYSGIIELLPAGEGLTYKISIDGKNILTLEVFEVINKSPKTDPNTGYTSKGGKVPMHHKLTFKRKK
jgi:hypothetical protein